MCSWTLDPKGYCGVEFLFRGNHSSWIYWWMVVSVKNWFPLIAKLSCIEPKYRSLNSPLLQINFGFQTLLSYLYWDLLPNPYLNRFNYKKSPLRESFLLIDYGYLEMIHRWLTQEQFFYHPEHFSSSFCKFFHVLPQVQAPLLSAEQVFFQENQFEVWINCLFPLYWLLQTEAKAFTHIYT